jgi:DNA adenine methylase
MIFRYPGGKSKKSIREKILSRFPKDYAEYREPMVGGGGIFFNIPVCKKRWINDIDDNLISVYLSLKNDPKSFIAKCREISPDEDLKSRFYKIIEDENFDKALKYFFVNRTVWAGRVNYEIRSRLYFSNPPGWKIVKTNKLEKAADVIKDVRVSSLSYKDVLREHGEDVLIYIDPPYYLNTKLDKNSRLYRCNFELDDHRELCEEIKDCKHKIILSYDDNIAIRRLYKGFNFGRGLGASHSRSEKWKYCGTSSARSQNQSKTKRVGKELIISNF